MDEGEERPDGGGGMGVSLPARGGSGVGKAMCLRSVGPYFVCLCILQHLAQGQTWEGCSRN